MKDKKLTNPTLKIERGVCENCIYCKLFSDDTWHCNFYPAYPKRVDLNKYCDVDNKSFFGFEHK